MKKWLRRACFLDPRNPLSGQMACACSAALAGTLGYWSGRVMGASSAAPLINCQKEIEHSPSAYNPSVHQATQPDAPRPRRDRLSEMRTS